MCQGVKCEQSPRYADFFSRQYYFVVGSGSKMFHGVDHDVGNRPKSVD